MTTSPAAQLVVFDMIVMMRQQPITNTVATEAPVQFDQPQRLDSNPTN